MSAALAWLRQAAFSPIPVGDGQTGFEAAWIKLESLPLREADRNYFAEIFRLLHERVEALERQQFTYDVYLQMTQIERPAGPLLISRNASRWVPRVGLGIWPDREPPQPLSKQDLFNTLPGQPMRDGSFRLMRIDDDTNTASLEVIDAMAGTGALLVAMVQTQAGASYRQSIAAHLEARVHAENFLGYPTYFPLLDAVSLGNVGRADLEAYLEGLTLYLREDLSQSALLIVSRIPLQQLFAGIYFELERPHLVHSFTGT